MKKKMFSLFFKHFIFASIGGNPIKFNDLHLINIGVFSLNRMNKNNLDSFYQSFVAFRTLIVYFSVLLLIVIARLLILSSIIVLITISIVARKTSECLLRIQ